MFFRLGLLFWLCAVGESVGVGMCHRRDSGGPICGITNSKRGGRFR